MKSRDFTMTIEEAIHALFDAKFAISDIGDSVTGGEIEDLEIRLRELKKWNISPERLRGFLAEASDYVLPRGRRGRITLVLNTPKTARAKALVVGILKSIR